MAKIIKSRPEMGKWRLWKFFAKNQRIRRYLPPTSLLSTKTLRVFLQRFRTVYIKPCGGQQGKGVIKAWKKGDRYIFVKEKGRKISCASAEQMYRTIKRQSPKRNHIVQRAIRLAEVSGRPFDIRLMMMRNATGNWEYVGMMAKVAGKGSVITNLGRGRGYALEADKAIRRSVGFRGPKLKKLKHEMIRLGYRSCRRFDDYKRYWQIGLDLAVDKQGRIWMIEENTGPAHSLFAKLRDKSVYRKMKRLTAYRYRRKPS